jgi:hypothetical protein
MGFRVFGEPLSNLMVYLDEFGHEGPFISRDHERHRTSPVFGLGGFWIPIDQVRHFSTWFYRLKCDLLKFEIERDQAIAHSWEKKGAALYTTRNVLQYQQLRRATNRLLNKIEKTGGKVFYVGVEKDSPQDHHTAKDLYRSVLREAIKRLDQHCDWNQCQFFMIMDEKEQTFRQEIVREAAIQMYGHEKKRYLIEPPIQAESHLFQTLQCADWLCGLIGRTATYMVLPEEYPELEWTEKYFLARLKSVSPNSGIRFCRPE